MGPTASGKTDLAIALTQYLPVDVISVDSAMVYKGMDIGSAKPSSEELAKAPHRLIDICDPVEPYSVADFCDDAETEIQRSIANGRIPLLVGGTMMYFKTLLDGLAEMPATDASVRAAIAEEAERLGWPVLHEQLMAVDPDYARQLHPNHSQRISRALEVYRLSGRTMTSFREEQQASQIDDTRLLANRFEVIQLALLPSERSVLHTRIEKRFLQMLEQGFVEEVKQLRNRGDLHLDLPSMRSVGYRQVWHYLDALEDVNQDYSYETMVHKGIVATRQLAKRQLTWLRGWSNLHQLPVDESMNGGTLQKNVEFILNFLPTKSI
ncbi:MAG: tRNA (adenosine(37)-N6)-dimethylallyltransferase MiaA [Cellvibrionaceae bacterium]